MSSDFEQHQRRSGVTVAVQLGHLPFLMLQAQPEQIAVKPERPVEVSNLDGHGVDPSRRKRPATYPFVLYRKSAPGSVAPELSPLASTPISVVTASPAGSLKVGGGWLSLSTTI